MKLSNGKDVDAEISRIQSKMDSVSQIKKELLGEKPDRPNIMGKMPLSSSQIVSPKNVGPLAEEPVEGRNSLEVALPKPFKLSSKRQNRLMEGNSNVKQIESALISEDRLHFPGDSIITTKNSMLYETCQSQDPHFQAIKNYQEERS